MNLTDIPRTMVQGETITWEECAPEYPASEGWVLKYVFRGNVASASFNVTATATGDDYLVEIASGTTTGKPVGRYDWQSYVELSGEKHYLRFGVISLLQNLADSTAPYDGRSYNEKMLAAIDAVLENRVTKDVEAYSINGRSLTKIPFATLRLERDRYARKVAGEKGKRKPKTINYRFNKP